MEIINKIKGYRFDKNIISCCFNFYIDFVINIS